ncbi:helix-turn-helix transcriptional regulator [Aquidulcibacter paucihalophilus]|uniref:helix-turn-helix transcriptional regulator n=1 Tax=Aquidulcibacter paucihalophilus TaxID=1978549 RepID=UPI000A18E4C2|nr:helix-turn-helix domain-containing protein [Aquidulcibacter paucihalophilus]
MAKRKPDASLAGQLDMFGDWQAPEPPSQNTVVINELPPSLIVKPANLEPIAQINAASRSVPANDLIAPEESKSPRRPGRPSAHRREIVHHGRALGDLDARALLRAPELAELLGLTMSTLAKLRCSGKGPPFYKLTNQTVGYHQDEVMEWLAKRRRVSTWTQDG